MNNSETKGIRWVIRELEKVIVTAKEEQSPMGYFPALYQEVSLKIEKGIHIEGYFKNPKRMNEVASVFAKRYIDAYEGYRNREDSISKCWKYSFVQCENYWPIVAQHLLLGINAHISLDLGIACAQVVPPEDFQEFKADFDKINTILSDLVENVESDLAKIWPTLHLILLFTGKFDNMLIDFSMKIARDAAWKFANELKDIPHEDWSKKIDEMDEALLQKYWGKEIKERDKKVVGYAKIIRRPWWFANLIFGIVRLGELGTVSERIQKLQCESELLKEILQEKK